MTTVSVALATYNGAEYLDEQLRSLARQRRLPDELVVTDDASVDDTVPRLQAFAADAAFPVRIYRNEERLGYRANFIRAAGLCRSDLIAFCDQDDIWDEGKLATCLDCFRKWEVLLVYHAATAITAKGEPLALLEQSLGPPVSPYLSLHPMNYALGFTQVFHRSLLDLSSLWPLSVDHKEVARVERMAHDQWFFFLASALGSVARIDEPLVQYRQHQGNSYGWRSRSRIVRLGEQLWPSLRGRTDEYAAWEKGAAARKRILADLAEAGSGVWKERATEGIEKYRLLENLYRERRRLYGSVELVQRAAAFCGILRDRGYRPKQDWGLGAKAFITDALLGVPAGRRLSATRSAR